MRHICILANIFPFNFSWIFFENKKNTFFNGPIRLFSLIIEISIVRRLIKITSFFFFFIFFFLFFYGLFIKFFYLFRGKVFSTFFAVNLLTSLILQFCNTCCIIRESLTPELVNNPLTNLIDSNHAAACCMICAGDTYTNTGDSVSRISCLAVIKNFLITKFCSIFLILIAFELTENLG